MQKNFPERHSKDCHFTVRTLPWNEQQQKEWIEGMCKLIVDIYTEKEGIQQELPFFEHFKKIK